MTDEEYRAAARELYVDDEDIDVDEDADVSRDERDEAPQHNEAGAYVQAWVWVAKPEEETAE